jgi:outer membrane protein assembly factor BamD (BamD/ComL family)
LFEAVSFLVVLSPVSISAVIDPLRVHLRVPPLRVACPRVPRANGAPRLAVVAAFLWCGTAYAQAPTVTLAPKRTLTTGPAPGCPIATGANTAARRDNAEARRLAAQGQEAALIGDQAAAREAFVRAAQLNPTDDRIAYDLARAHEELNEHPRAIAEFCRYLTLSPAGREAADVRDRLSRLVPSSDQQRADNVLVAFRLGLALLDDGRYEPAARAFDDVVAGAPAAPESFYNRGLARAAAGRRTDAVSDLEQFRANAPTVDDRVAVGRAIELLRRPVYRPATAALRGVVPGFGEFYTGRPVRGAIALVVAAGGSALAFVEQTNERVINYVDPNGVPAPYSERTRERPYASIGLGSAVGITVLAFIDAVQRANRSQRGGSILARREQPVSVDLRLVPIRTATGAMRTAPTLRVSLVR